MNDSGIPGELSVNSGKTRIFGREGPVSAGGKNPKIPVVAEEKIWYNKHDIMKKYSHSRFLGDGNDLELSNYERKTTHA